MLQTDRQSLYIHASHRHIYFTSTTFSIWSETHAWICSRFDEKPSSLETHFANIWPVEAVDPGVTLNKTQLMSCEELLIDNVKQTWFAVPRLGSSSKLNTPYVIELHRGRIRATQEKLGRRRDAGAARWLPLYALDDWHAHAEPTFRTSLMCVFVCTWNTRTPLCATARLSFVPSRSLAGWSRMP